MPQTPLGQIFGLNPSSTVKPIQTDADGYLILSEDTVDAIAAAIIAGGLASNSKYETVAAGQSAQVLGATGAVGDILDTLIIVPGTTAAGAVSITDGNGSAITLFVGGGTTALIDLAPKVVHIGAACVNSTTPGWKVTTGNNVTVLAVGKFT